MAWGSIPDGSCRPILPTSAMPCSFFADAPRTRLKPRPVAICRRLDSRISVHFFRANRSCQRMGRDSSSQRVGRRGFPAVRTAIVAFSEADSNPRGNATACSRMAALRIVGENEIGNARNDFGTESRAVEHTVMTDTELQVMRLHVR